MKMKKLINLFVCLLFATSVLVVAGCAKKEEPAKPAAEAASLLNRPSPLSQRRRLRRRQRQPQHNDDH